MSTLHVYIFGLILIFSVYETAGSCNDTSCSYGETCEPSLDKCMKDSDRVSCSSKYYCYRPTTCCAVLKCCSEGSYCRGGQCYSGTTDSSLTFESKSNTGVKWYYYVGIGSGILAVVAVIIGVCVKVSRSRRAQQSNGGATAMAAVNSPYSTGPAAQQPHPYTVAALNPSAPYGGQPAQYGGQSALYGGQPEPYGGQPSSYNNTNYKTEYSNAGFNLPSKIETS